MFDIFCTNKINCGGHYFFSILLTIHYRLASEIQKTKNTIEDNRIHIKNKTTNYSVRA